MFGPPRPQRGSGQRTVQCSSAAAHYVEVAAARGRGAAVRAACSRRSTPPAATAGPAPSALRAVARTAGRGPARDGRGAGPADGRGAPGLGGRVGRVLDLGREDDVEDQRHRHQAHDAGHQPRQRPLAPAAQHAAWRSTRLARAWLSVCLCSEWPGAVPACIPQSTLHCRHYKQQPPCIDAPTPAARP
jgi:hypothetical protein